MKNKAVLIAATVCSAIVLASCSTYEKIYSSQDRSVNFDSYSTFAWIPDSTVRETNEFANTAYDNDIIRNNAKNYISHLLSKRGYLVQTDSPDLLVQLVLLNDKQERVVTSRNYPYHYYYFNNFYHPYYYPYYRYYTWYGWNYPPFWNVEVTSVTKSYVKGTITVNIYDRQLKKLIWSGSAEGDIYDPSYINRDVHPAIDRIMEKFPGKPKLKMKEDDVFRGRIANASRMNGGSSYAGGK